jgi:O-antigen/teichoic acid export membrane protein
VGEDLRWLSRRARHINRAIAMFTLAALLVCVIIAMLFVSAFFTPDISRLVATLFVVTMGALILGLVSFLREVYHATRSLRIGPH